MDEANPSVAKVPQDQSVTWQPGQGLQGTDLFWTLARSTEYRLNRAGARENNDLVASPVPNRCPALAEKHTRDYLAKVVVRVRPPEAIDRLTESERINVDERTELDNPNAGTITHHSLRRRRCVPAR